MQAAFLERVLLANLDNKDDFASAAAALLAGQLQDTELHDAGLYLWKRVEAGGALLEAPMVLRMGCRKLRELAVASRRELTDLRLDGDLLEAGGVGDWDDELTLLAMFSLLGIPASQVTFWTLTRIVGQDHFECILRRDHLPQSQPAWLSGSTLACYTVN